MAHEPTSFPTAISYAAGPSEPEFDFLLADREAFAAFWANRGSMKRGLPNNFDGVALKATAAEGPVTTEGLRKSLKAGASWREPVVYEPDGPEERCLGCGAKSRGIVIPRKGEHEGEEPGGNYTSLSAEKVEKLTSSQRTEVDDLSARIFAEDGQKSVPSGLKTRAAFFCRKDREDMIRTGRIPAKHFRTRGQMVVAMLSHDSRVAEAIDRGSRREALRGALTAGTRRNEQPRPPKTFEAVDGVSFEPRTAEAVRKLVAEGKLGSATELSAKTASELVELGVVPHERAGEAVLGPWRTPPTGRRTSGSPPASSPLRWGRR